MRSVYCLVIVLALLACIGCGPTANTFVEPPPPEVTVSSPVEQPVTDSLELTGTTAAVESVEVRARVQGFLERIDFADGARVKAGELLFEIDPRTYQAEYDRDDAALVQARAHLTRAKSDFKRAEELLPKNAISQSDYDLTVSERDEAEAAVQVAEANLRAAKLNLDFTKVLAPISGRASRRLVDKGNLVGASEKTLLTTIVNDDSIYAYANMSEYDLLRLNRKYRRDPQADSKPEQRTKALLGLADETGYPHEGWIDFVDNTVDPGTGTLRVRAIFPNDKRLLIPGLFVRLCIPLETHPGLLVPDLAVLADQSGRYVLVVNDQDVVEQRSVTAGATVDHMRVIENGLTPSDRVVVNGLQRARPGVKVKPIPAPQQKGAS